jgi:cytochrome bd-type quinol oxidase subunit 2
MQFLHWAVQLFPFEFSLTLYEAAAQPETMRFTLWGAVIVLPIVIACIVYSYSVFRGKVSPEGSSGSGG